MVEIKISEYVDKTLYELSGFTLSELFCYREMSTPLPYDIGAFVSQNIRMSCRVDTILMRSFKGPGIRDEDWSMRFIKPKTDHYYYLR